MLKIGVAICLFAAAVGLNESALAQSQPPPPSDREISQLKQSEPKAAKEEVATDYRGTDKSPIVVKVLAAPDDQEKAQQDAADRNEKAAQDQSLNNYSFVLDILTGILALVGLLQLCVFGYQAFQLRRTVKAMDDQSADMKKYVGEAARAANAMENVSKSLKISADKINETVEINRAIGVYQRKFGEMQLRAYIGVTIGPATYQDANNRFAAAPIFFNTGHTPAYQFRYRVMAEILPVPLPSDYKFKLPPRTKASILVPPSQRPEAYTIVKDRIDDTAVEDVKRGRGKSLFVWGLATYNDAFGKTRRVTFLQQIYWVGEPGKETVRGLYLDRHSQSN